MHWSGVVLLLKGYKEVELATTSCRCESYAPTLSSNVKSGWGGGEKAGHRAGI